MAQPHPPIWIGGNSAGARRRVAERADGWAPFPAHPLMAEYIRTAALDSTEKLAAAIQDLQRRLETAGRDPASVDICFANRAGGNPAKDTFDPDAHLQGLSDLAAMGVTWVQFAPPGDSLARADETIARYGELVIAPHRARG